jgi:hypothetical protein
VSGHGQHGEYYGHYSSSALKFVHRYNSGARACQTYIYEAGQWPRGLIAPATVIWRPETSTMAEVPTEIAPSFSCPSSSGARVLWIRVHPAALENVMVALKAANQKVPASDQVEITDLSGDVNSFELVGPRTSQVIHGVFKLASAEHEVKKVKAYTDLRNHILILFCLVLAIARERKVAGELFSRDDCWADSA